MIDNESPVDSDHQHDCRILRTVRTRTVDATRKKTAPAALAAVEAPAAVAMETVEEESGDDLAIVAVIAAALAAMGESGHVSVIRRIDGTSWTQMGRMDAVNTRTQMY